MLGLCKPLGCSSLWALSFKMAVLLALTSAMFFSPVPDLTQSKTRVKTLSRHIDLNQSSLYLKIMPLYHCKKYFSQTAMPYTFYIIVFKQYVYKRCKLFFNFPRVIFKDLFYLCLHFCIIFYYYKGMEFLDFNCSKYSINSHKTFFCVLLGVTLFY